MTHIGRELLAAYSDGTIDDAASWSVETHVMTCPDCREGLAEHADAARLARNRQVLLVRTALPDRPPLLRLLAATPSLRLSWLLSVLGVLTVVTGEALLVRDGWHGRMPDLTPFVLVAPLLVLAGVAAAFLPPFDPAHLLAVAAPYPGIRLLLIRTVAALATALVPVVIAALVEPGPGWLPAALLLPTLALCGIAVAAGTLVDPVVAAAGTALLWVVPVLAFAARDLPLEIVRWPGQAGAAVALLLAGAVLVLRHDRLELGRR